MLKEDLITKKDFDLKMKIIASNVKMIEEAYENGPESLHQLEVNLGLISEIKQVHTLAEMAHKNQPSDYQS